ncbi:MAG: 4Fe-4S cluster-binding domain-containing protein [bacterium]|nr:4Fe-4S cluster-binding domain-containing protein [bacterium]
MEKNNIQAKFKFCQWELITDCNLECEGCQVRNKITAGYQHPKIEFVISCIDDLICAGVQNLEFIGGEPLLYRDLPAALEYLNRQKEIKRFAILTNAISRDALQRIKPELSQEKGGLAVSINYTLEQCDELLSAGIDTGMVKKSIAGWKALEEFSEHCWVRANCAVNKINGANLAEIALKVAKTGGSFSLCPLIYKREKYDSGLEFTFRSPVVGLAAVKNDRKTIERSIMEIRKLKREYPKQIIPSEDYLKMVIESCKDSAKPYSANCGGLGLPYLRVSSEVGKSLRDGKTSFRLRACSDIKGSDIPRLVTSDLRDSNIRKRLPFIYQSDAEVKKCCEREGCVWSVTHLLAPKALL